MPGNFERFVSPESPESYAPHLQNNTIIGWVSGEIVDVSDLQRIGRVKVKCDLISSSETLPTSDDSYAWVLEDFVLANMAGGSHRPLEAGVQVALLPMMGDPTKMLVLGCIPSFVDRPCQECDRSQQLYGSQTRNGVYKICNDTDQSEVHAYPHGVTSMIDGQGNSTLTTAGGATTQNRSDGTIVQQNPNASTIHNPDGSVEQQNAAGGSNTLTAEGERVMRSPSGAALMLRDTVAEIIGPLDEKSGLLNGLNENLSGISDLFREQFGKIQELLGGLPVVPDLLEQIAPELENILGNLDGYLNQASGLLNQFQGFDLNDLGASVSGQVDRFLGGDFHDLLGEAQGAIANLDFGDLSQVTSLVEKFGLGNEYTELLQSLSHNPKAAFQAIADKIIPDGISQYANLFDLDLAGNIGDIVGQIDKIKAARELAAARTQGGAASIAALSALAQDSSTTTAMLTAANQAGVAAAAASSSLFDQDESLFDLDALTQELFQMLPQALQSFLPADILKNITGITELLGRVIQGRSQNLGDVLSDVQNQVASSIGQLAEEFASTTDPDIQKLAALAQQAGTLQAETMQKLQGIEQENQALQEAAQKTGQQGASIRATGSTVEAGVDSEGSGAITSPRLMIDRAKAALQAIGGGAEVFATQGNAGLSAFGSSFSLGSLGGQLLSQGSMLMQVLQGDGQKSMGLLFDKALGVVMGNFNNLGGGLTEKLGGLDQIAPTSFISMANDIVTLTSGIGRDNLAVSPGGIFLNSSKVGGSVDMGEFVGEVLKRLDSLESSYSSFSAMIITMQSQLATMETAITDLNASSSGDTTTT